MRWDNLFDDLESQLEHELDAEDIDLLAEEERLRLGRLGLRDRIRAMMPSTNGAEPLALLLVDGTRIAVGIGATGRDWIAGEIANEGARRASCVIPIAAIASCLPTPAQAIASIGDSEPQGVGSLAGRLGLTFVLRDLCRRRAALHVGTERETVHGTIDRVGRDHFDLAEHDAGSPRREREVHRVRLMPIAELVLVRF